MSRGSHQSELITEGRLKIGVKNTIQSLVSRNANLLIKCAKKGDKTTYNSLVTEILKTASIYQSQVTPKSWDLARAVVYNASLDDKLGYTALHIAADSGKRGLSDFVTFLALQPGIDINKKSESEHAALHRAAIRGFPNVVSALLQNKSIKVDIQGRDNWTPCHMAAANWGNSKALYGRSLEELKSDYVRIIELLRKAGASLEAETDGINPETNKKHTVRTIYFDTKTHGKGTNPFVQGVITLQSRIADGIDNEDISSFQDYISQHPDWHKETINGLPLQHYAAKQVSCVFFVHLLLQLVKQRSVSIKDLLTENDSYGSQAVHYAAENTKDWRVLEYIIKQGVDLNSIDGLGMTPLELAKNAHTTLLPRRRDEFHQALKEGKTKRIAEFLQENLHWMDVPDPSSNWKPLAIAIGSQKLVEFVHALGELRTTSFDPVPYVNDPHVSHVAGSTSLAVWCGVTTDVNGSQLEGFRWLLKYCRDLLAPQDANGNTFFHLCISAAPPIVLQFLMSPMCDIKFNFSVENNAGDTPLTLAAKQDKFDALFLLLREAKAASIQIPFLQLIENIVGLKRSNSLMAKEATALRELFDIYRDDLVLFDEFTISNLIVHAIKAQSTPDVLEILLSHPNANPKWCDAEGNTFMHYAAQHSLELVQFFDEKYGLSLTEKNFLGFNPDQIGEQNELSDYKCKLSTQYCFGIGRADDFQYFSKALLMSYSAGEKSPIHFAAETKYLLILRRMLAVFGGPESEDWKRFVNVQFKGNVEGNVGIYTPLAIALGQGTLVTAEFLLQHGADPKLKSTFGINKVSSAFIFCLVQGYVGLVRLTLSKLSAEEASALVNKPFNWITSERLFRDLMPLHAAIQGDYPLLCCDLLRAGADVSAIVLCNRGELNAVFRTNSEGHNPVRDIYNKQFLEYLKKSDQSPETFISFLKEYNPTWLRIIDEKTKRSPLHELAKQGNTVVLKQLSEQFNPVFQPLIDVRDETELQQTALHHAVQSKNPEAVALLVRLGADINVQDSEGNTPLHLAYKFGNNQMTQALEGTRLVKNKFNHFPEDTPRFEVSFLGIIPLAQLPNATQRAKIESQKQLKIRIEQDDLGEVQSLLNSNSKLLDSDNVEALLKLAAESGAYKVFQFLGQQYLERRDAEANSNVNYVQKYINLEVEGGDGRCLVHFLAKASDWELADWYHKNGANFRSKARTPFDKNNTPLHIAVNKSRLSGVEKFISYGVDLDDYSDYQCCKIPITPLMLAVRTQCSEIIDRLLEAGADPGIRIQYYGSSGSRKKKGAIDCESLDGYLHRKIKMLRKLLEKISIIENDFENFPKTIECESLRVFVNVAAQQRTNDLRETGRLLSDIPNQYNRFVLYSCAKYLKITGDTLSVLSESVGENYQSFIEERSRLMYEAFAPYGEKYKELFLKTPDRYETFYKDIEHFQVNLDTSRGKSLGERHNSLFSSESRRLLFKENRPTEDLGATVKEYTKLCDLIDRVYEEFPRLEADFKVAQRALFDEQSQKFSEMELEIKELRRLMMEALPEKILKKESGNPFVLQSSFQELAAPVLDAIDEMEASNQNGSCENIFLSVRANSLKKISDGLQKLLPDLQAAEKKHLKSQEAQVQKDEQKREKQERHAAEEERRKFTSFVQSTLKEINQSGLALAVESLKMHKNSPVYHYWMTLEDELLPKEKSYYTEDLKRAIQSVRRPDLALRRLLHVSDNVLEKLPEQKSVAQRVPLDKKDEFLDAAKELKAKLPLLQGGLSSVFDAEQKDAAREQRETQLRIELQGHVGRINQASTGVLKTLNGKPIDSKRLTPLTHFRNKISTSTADTEDLSPLILKQEQISNADEDSLQEFCAFAEQAYAVMSAYYEELDQENFLKSKACDGIQAQAQNLSKVLEQIREALAEKPLNTEALLEVDAFRGLVHCGNTGIDPVIVSTSTIQSISDQKELNTIEAAGTMALHAAQRYLAAVEKEQQKASVQSEKEAVLRSTILKTIKLVNAELAKIVLRADPDNAALTDIVALRRLVDCPNAGVAEINVTSEFLEPKLEAELNSIKEAIAPALNAARAYRAVVKREVDLYDVLIKELATLNKTLKETHGLMDKDEMPDEKALRTVEILRGQIQCLNVDSCLDPVEPKERLLECSRETDLSKFLAQAKEAQRAAGSYYKSVFNTKDQETKKRELLKQNVLKINVRFETLLALQGETDYSFAITEPLLEIRQLLGCTNQVLDPIRLNLEKIKQMKSDALDGALRQLSRLDSLINEDVRGIQRRNNSGLYSALSNKLFSFNNSLSQLGNVAENKENVLSEILGSINALAKRIGNEKRKPFGALQLSDNKVNQIPPEQHPAIADELVRLTEWFNKKCAELEKIAQEERVASGAKEDALAQLEQAIIELNDLVAATNQQIEQGGKLAPSYVKTMDYLRSRFEKPNTGLLSKFSKKIPSTETKLQCIVFDKSYCGQTYTKEVCVNNTKEVRQFIRDLVSIAEKTSEVKRTQEILAALTDDIQDLINQLSGPLSRNMEVRLANSLVNTRLRPASTNPRTVDQLDGLKEEEQEARDSIAALKALVEVQDQKRRETKEAITPEIRRLNVGMEKLRGLLDKHKWDVGAIDLLQSTREFFDDTSTDPLADIQVGPDFYKKDLSIRDITAEIEAAKPIMEKVAANINEKIEAAKVTEKKSMAVAYNAIKKQIQTIQSPDAKAVLEARLQEAKRLAAPLKDTRATLKAFEAVNTELKHLLKEAQQVATNNAPVPTVPVVSLIASTTASPVVASSALTVTASAPPAVTSPVAAAPAVQPAPAASPTPTAPSAPVTSPAPIAPKGNFSTPKFRNELAARSQEVMGGKGPVEVSESESRSSEAPVVATPTVEATTPKLKAAMPKVKATRPKLKATTPKQNSVDASSALDSGTSAANVSLPKPEPITPVERSSRKTRKSRAHRRRDPITTPPSVVATVAAEDNVALNAAVPPTNQTILALTEEKKREIAAYNEKMLTILETFKRRILDVPRRSLVHHFNVVFEKTFTPEENYHIQAVLEYLNGKNDEIKKLIATLQPLTNPSNIKNLSNYLFSESDQYIRNIRGVTSNITKMLDALVTDGFAIYFGKDPQKSQKLCLQGAKVGAITGMKRLLIKTQTEYLEASPVGIYSNLKDLFAALSVRVKENSEDCIEPEIKELEKNSIANGSSGQSSTPKRPVQNNESKEDRNTEAPVASDRTTGNGQALFVPYKRSAPKQSDTIDKTVKEINQYLGEARAMLEGLEDYPVVNVEKHLESIAELRTVVGCNARGNESVTVNPEVLQKALATTLLRLERFATAGAKNYLKEVTAAKEAKARIKLRGESSGMASVVRLFTPSPRREIGRSNCDVVSPPPTLGRGRGGRGSSKRSVT